MQLIGFASSTGSSNSLTVSSIPATFSQIKIVFSGRSADTATYFVQTGLRFNGDTSTNYSFQALDVVNATLTGTTGITQTSIPVGPIPSDGAAANFGGQIIIDVIAYRNTTFFKSVTSTQGWTTATASQGRFRIVGASWASTAAINSVTLFDVSTSNFKNGSTLYVYGY